MKRIFCFALAAAWLFLIASCGKSPSQPQPSTAQRESVQDVYSARPGSWSKQEAVFVSISPTGAVQSVSVTDRIQTDRPQVRVDDLSVLRNIQNLKGDEQPVTDGINLTWHMPTTQLYYTGETDKQPPVALQIDYTLNGQPVEPSALRDRAGTVDVRVRAENQHKQGELYTPFLLAGGMILPEGAEDVHVENGGSFGDGSRDVAFGLLLPGMAENLAVQDARFLPESFTISFKTQKCRIGEIYFLLLPLSTLQLEDTLQAVFGSFELPQLDLEPLLGQIRALNDSGELQALLRDLPQSTALFSAASDAMHAYAQEQPLLDVLQTYLTQENAQLLSETIDSLSGTTLSEYAKLLQEPTFIALLSDMSVVSAAFTRLIPTLSAFIADLNTPQVRTAVQNLPEMMARLEALEGAIRQNGSLLTMLSDFSERGAMTQVSTLYGSVQNMLQSGTLEALQGLSGKADLLRNRIETTLELGKKYGIFTAAPQDAQTGVYFIYKTTITD
ncbi:MAG: hypothetical protein IJT44_07205 [Clostridia bacterium]|nr:hypothetical protein [Clostridia bacterium]